MSQSSCFRRQSQGLSGAHDSCGQGLLPSHSGVSSRADGVSHQVLEQILEISHVVPGQSMGGFPIEGVHQGLSEHEGHAERSAMQRRGQDHSKPHLTSASAALAPLLLGRYETELLLAGQVPVVLTLGRAVRLLGFVPTAAAPGCHGCDCSLAMAREQIIQVLPVGGVEGPPHAMAWLLGEPIDSVS